MTSTHVAHAGAWGSVREGDVGNRSGIRRLLAALRGDPRHPDDDLMDPHHPGPQAAEDRMRQQIAGEILAEIDRVISAPTHVYAHRIAELSSGPADRLFWDGVLEGMLIAADVVSARLDSPAD